MEKRGPHFNMPDWRSWLEKVKTRARGILPQKSKQRTTSRRSRQDKSGLQQIQMIPTRIRELRESLPSGTDEVMAIVLIVFGIVSVLALMNFSPDSTVTSGWAEGFRRLFGLGSFLVALGVVAVGLFILLPRVIPELELRLPWQRVLALEIAFVSFLALLHLMANDPEPRALARIGQGGGYVGWALSQLIVTLFDQTTSTIVYGIIFVIALSQSFGVRRRHLRQILDLSVTRLEVVAENLEARAGGLEEELDAAQDAPLEQGQSGPQYRRARPSVVPRDNSASTPAVPSTHVKPVVMRPPTADEIFEDDEDEDLFQQPDLPHYINPPAERLARGLSSPGLPGERASVVPRSDEGDEAPYLPVSNDRKTSVEKIRDAEGRLVRYFRAEDLQESRKVGSRGNLPPLELLADTDLNRPDDDEINGNARIIEETLSEFGIHVEVIDVMIGPTVTQYAVQPFKEIINDEGERVISRVRVGKIASLERDLALALEAKRLRIQAPVPGTSYVGVEVPNRQPSTVMLRGVVESEIFFKKKSPLALPLGRDVSGASFVADLATMPHLLIAGTTGSGKSVALTSMAASLVMNNTPDTLKLVMLDPKMVELTRFKGLPHLLGPVETDQERILGVLKWAAREMDRRYDLLALAAKRNIVTYNKSLGGKRKSERLPYIVIFFDEIGDLMLSRPDETEKTLARLAQMARAVGIHLVVATQRPSVDVITGLIKANFPARISFAVASGVDSRVILDSVGAETLMGRGDMLYQAADAAGPQRVQGCFVSDDELTSIVDFWSDWKKESIAAGMLEENTLPPWERGMTRRAVLSETDSMLEETIQLVLDAGEASASLIQRRLGLGYPRAARLMDLLEELGIIGEAKSGGRTREVLYRAGDDPFQEMIDKRVNGD